MSIIYEPRGKAREYSPLAANFYDGCDHRCAYCYAPGIRRKTRDQYAVVTPRRDILHQLEKDCKKYAFSKRQVLFNFMGDPYCEAEETHRITSRAIRLLHDYKIPVAILTKGGMRAMHDIEALVKFGDHAKIGATLTFDDRSMSQQWEPGAAIPDDRYQMLSEFHSRGVKTWASFEPVIDPAQSLKAIRQTIDIVDEYKIGKLNNYGGIDKSIDWTAFLTSVVAILRDHGKPFYIKHDLRLAAPSVKLYGNEVLPDEFCLPPFSHNDDGFDIIV